MLAFGFLCPFLGVEQFLLDGLDRVFERRDRVAQPPLQAVASALVAARDRCADDRAARLALNLLDLLDGDGHRVGRSGRPSGRNKSTRRDDGADAFGHSAAWARVPLQGALEPQLVEAELRMAREADPGRPLPADRKKAAPEVICLYMLAESLVDAGRRRLVASAVRVLSAAAALSLLGRY